MKCPSRTILNFLFKVLISESYSAKNAVYSEGKDLLIDF